MPRSFHFHTFTLILSKTQVGEEARWSVTRAFGQFFSTWHKLVYRWVKKHGDPCPEAAASGNAQMDLGKLGGVFIVVVLGMVSLHLLNWSQHAPLYSVSVEKVHLACWSKMLCCVPNCNRFQWIPIRIIFPLRFLPASLQSLSLPFSDASWLWTRMWVIQLPLNFSGVDVH